jgi:hypothetical protein
VRTKKKFEARNRKFENKAKYKKAANSKEASFIGRVLDFRIGSLPYPNLFRISIFGFRICFQSR